MSSTDVSRLDSADVQLAHLRNELATIETVEEATEQTDRARAIEAYAHAKKSREMVNKAVELRIWAERRAGELAIAERLNFTQLYEQHSVNVQEASRWIHLAFVDQHFIESLLEEIRESGQDITIHRVLTHVIDASKRRVAPGVYALADGRYQFTWKEGKQRRTRTAQAKNDEAALVRLAKYKRIAPPQAPGTSDLSTVYGQIRVALGRCDAALPLVSPPARAHLTDTMTALHAAEDAIQLAKKENEVAR